MALLFLCGALFLNIILLLSMTKKQKQICNKGDVLAVNGVSCFRRWWRNNMHETRGPGYHQLSRAWEVGWIFWFFYVFKHYRSSIFVIFFFLFYHLDIANLCLQAQKMPKFSLIILSILSLDDKHGGSQKNYLQAMAQNTNLIAK